MGDGGGFWGPHQSELRGDLIGDINRVKRAGSAKRLALLRMVSKFLLRKCDAFQRGGGRIHFVQCEVPIGYSCGNTLRKETWGLFQTFRKVPLPKSLILYRPRRPSSHMQLGSSKREYLFLLKSGLSGGGKTTEQGHRMHPSVIRTRTETQCLTFVTAV